MRWLKFLAALVIALLSVEAIARGLEPHLPPATTWSHPFVQAKYAQLEDIEQDGGAQLLVVGSSLVNANVDALALQEQLGVTAYNVGLPASNIPLWSAYLEDIALERACPGVVVFGVGVRDSNDHLPGYEGYVPRFRDSLGRRALDGDVTFLEHVQMVAEDVSAFVRLRPRLREPANVATWLVLGRAAGWTDTKLDAGGRYLNFGDKTFPDRYDDQIADLRDRVMADYQVGGRQFEALGDAIRAVQAAGATAVIVDMPGMEELIADAMPAGRADLDRFHAELAEVAAQLQVPILDPRSLDDRPELYADLYHMNDAGAAELTAVLAQWLGSLDLNYGRGCSG